jgi:hypothetical protein
MLEFGLVRRQPTIRAQQSSPGLHPTLKMQPLGNIAVYFNLLRNELGKGREQA